LHRTKITGDAFYQYAVPLPEDPPSTDKTVDGGFILW
jgi:hypothetical protein